MRFGVTMFATDRSMSVVELAREAEARSFDSLYLPEHTHIPVERRTPPPTGDAESQLRAAASSETQAPWRMSNVQAHSARERRDP